MLLSDLTNLWQPDINHEAVDHFLLLRGLSPPERNGFRPNEYASARIQLPEYPRCFISQSFASREFIFFCVAARSRSSSVESLFLVYSAAVQGSPMEGPFLQHDLESKIIRSNDILLRIFSHHCTTLIRSLFLDKPAGLANVDGTNDISESSIPI
ncbi:uncharacterized protein BT62DRAFT_1077528 [Guyanagaster necrorhizus]|uniref:Uncharacterized protein n=1 Tax=Guyanagaster necrorhizus TaxID=856835 RepID=A0A9P8AQW3_9AGAR|nr:uncharacterized protein BT62DRAFT_1077528 [Guyanagaster necrorhizus MCA 3950]KAG7444768.1 hypothetical protein BT62DRAFT_1077528 [Guyanagaster necrorhizus MCA 3950]